MRTLVRLIAVTAAVVGGFTLFPNGTFIADAHAFSRVPDVVLAQPGPTPHGPTAVLFCGEGPVANAHQCGDTEVQDFIQEVQSTSTCPDGTKPSLNFVANTYHDTATNTDVHNMCLMPNKNDACGQPNPAYVDPGSGYWYAGPDVMCPVELPYCTGPYGDGETCCVHNPKTHSTAGVKEDDVICGSPDGHIFRY